MPFQVSCTPKASSLPIHLKATHADQQALPRYADGPVRKEALWGKRKYSVSARIISLASINKCQTSTKGKDQQRGRGKQIAVNREPKPVIHSGLGQAS